MRPMFTPRVKRAINASAFIAQRNDHNSARARYSAPFHRFQDSPSVAIPSQKSGAPGV
jgi:hypothetical protein